MKYTFPFIVTLLLMFFLLHDRATASEKRTRWSVQSIDTMKYSRDLSKEKMKDPAFDLVIDEQMSQIANVGATHVAIGTPYDEEFVPMMKRWVKAARKHHLSVWFRGNFSGWEGWFDYGKISRQTHLAKTEAFILKHQDLFEDGDIFSSCPECENGGPGNPGDTKDIQVYRSFLIQEYQVAKNAFGKIHKNVRPNYFSMNSDVAKLIMDKETTSALGGVVVIDHYVLSPDQLVRDIHRLVQQSGGKIILGEFGAPIPDIHGTMTDSEQALWVEQALEKVASRQEVIGVNYWVNKGGTTAIWKVPGQQSKTAIVIQNFFAGKIITIKLFAEDGTVVKHARVRYGHRVLPADKNGAYNVAYTSAIKTLTITAPEYKTQTIVLQSNTKDMRVIMKRDENILEMLKKAFYTLLPLSFINKYPDIRSIFNI